MKLNQFEVEGCVQMKGLHLEEGRLQRIPEKIRGSMEKETKEMLLKPAGNEIRFVMNTGAARIVLENAADEPGTVTVFFGDFQGETFEIRKELSMEIEMPAHLMELNSYPCQVPSSGGSAWSFSAVLFPCAPWKAIFENRRRMSCRKKRWRFMGHPLRTASMRPMLL